ncbi:MAG: hypothetical protein IJX63_06250, partial [Lachnospiraceae bacterium]|nr:hypothetical protein [Lachnospiraceae bacterium]
GGDSYIQNGEFGLAVRKGHELTSNLFAEGWPVLYGYIASSPKTASSSIITAAEKDDPILTVWQYGLGRTVAWNSDVSGEWSGAYSGKEDYVQLWKRIVDYSTGNASLGEDRVDVITAGEVTEILYETQEYSADTEILATVIDPEGQTSEVKLYATAPGKYETEVPTASTGMYHFNIRRTEQEEIRNYITTAATVQFSDEYKFDVSTEAYVSFAEKYGRIIRPEENIWTKPKTNVKGKKDLTNWLLGIAIILFLVDVALRRFQYVPRWKGIGIGRRMLETASETTEQTLDFNQEAESKKMVAGEMTETASETKAVIKEAKPKRKQTKSTEQTLDTSQLLKKKDDRNI